MALTQISTKGIKDGTITNADIGASAAIAGTKISPDFGSQSVVTTGGLGSGNFTITSNTPTITFTDSDNNPDYKIITNGGAFLIHDSTNGTDKIKILNGAEIDITPNVDFANGIDVTGAITSTGNIDCAGSLTTGGFTSTTAGDALFTGTTSGRNAKWDTSHNRLIFDDNAKAEFGSSGDLQIYHDVNNSIVANQTGELRIRSDNLLLLDNTNEHKYISALKDDAVELYYDNTKRFETTSGGSKVTGNFICTGDIVLDSDSNKLKLGLGEDLQIYHDGYNSFVKNAGTGTLILEGSGNVDIKHGGEVMASFIQDGSAELYYDNSKKFETTSAGVTVTGTCTATSFAGDGSSLTGITSQGKNLIFNGGMRIHQRGTASYTLNSGNQNDYVVDRFKVNSGSGTIVASQSTTVPAGQGFSNSIKLDCTVADSNPNSEGYIQYLPEAQNFYHLAYGTSGAKTITASFWVKSSLAATYGFYYYMPDTARAYQTTFSISSANTWEKKTITIPGDTSGGGFNNDNGIGAELRIYFYSTAAQRGSSNQNSWGTNASNRIPSGTNLVSSTSNDFFFTGFQIEVGSQATDYDFCSYAKELSYCQRYYWKIATNTYRRVNGYKRHDANSFWEVKCPVPMRTAPSPTLLTSGTFTNFQSNFNTTQTSPVVNEWNTDTGMGLLHVQSTWGDTHKTIPSWEGYQIEFSAELG